MKAMKKILVSFISLFFIASASVTRAENIGVPSESEDVMLQAFYWDSYKTQTTTDSKYGRTKWIDLLPDTAALTANFDLIWFPPSAMGGGVGYTPKQYSNQSGDWGTKMKLDELITALHRGGTKVIADIVINHRGNSNSWCTFYSDNFGSYGTYQLTQSHICYGDEGFTNSQSSCYGSSNRGSGDTGTDFSGARDLDHSNEYVQRWAKAYLQWMLNTMKYDGFRYDMTLGYAGQYLKMYNEAANPYISVSEFWESNDRQVQHLQETGFNTMIFDFPLKYRLHDAINSNPQALGQLVNPGKNSLRGRGYAKYAVTFIDNHDTFERSDNQGGEFYKYNASLSSSVTKQRIMMAYAYILMMPGIPCVFYPHWKSYEKEISELIALRKRAGIHSESQVSDESGKGTKYEAKIVGHHHTVILRLGTEAIKDKSVPEGYEEAIAGSTFLPYSIYISTQAQGIEEVQRDEVQSTKFIRNGKLYIRYGEQEYDGMGNRLQ